MMAKTKRQKNILALNSKVKKIQSKHKKWFFDNVVSKKAVRLKSGKITCLHCGHEEQSESKIEWHDLILERTCPGCNTLNRVETTTKKNFNSKYYFLLIDVVEDHQLIRLFKIDYFYKSGEKHYESFNEIARTFISPKGLCDVIGSFKPSKWQANWSSNFELRSHKTIWNYVFGVDEVYPEQKIIPELYRNGYDDNLHGIHPVTVFRKLLLSKYHETLYKSKFLNLFDYFENEDQVEKYWPSLKICIKNNYFIQGKDISTWVDQVNLLKTFGKDILNPKYICPKNLDKEHNFYIKKARRLREIELRIEAKEKNEKKKIFELQREDKYTERFSGFIGLKLSKGIFEAKFLDKISEFIEKENETGCCIFSSDYFKKPNSLIFSVNTNGKLDHIAEFDLKTFKVIQCRTFKNDINENTDKIVEFLNSNADEIKKRLKPLKKKSEIVELV